MKVLHLPANVAGNAYGLAQGEQSWGLDSKTLSIGRSSLNFPSQLIIPASKNRFNQLYHRIKTFYKIRKKYDVYHFNFGSSLIHYLDMGINLLDLPFYTNQATKIVTYQGCDARQKFPTMMRIKQQPKQFAACFEQSCYGGICNSGKRDIARQKAIEKMMRYADYSFALNPDLLRFLPKDKCQFLPYTIPNFHKIKGKSGPFFANDKIKIVHAPTQRITKGTKYILSAIEHLEQCYPGKVELELVENLSYKQALEVYRSADLVIDQLLIGWYGGLAVEVMKMGIPVAVYINSNDLEFVPSEFANDLPFIRTNPETLVQTLADIIKQRDCLPELGIKSQQFVNKWHDPKYVASITKDIYEQYRK